MLNKRIPIVSQEAFEEVKKKIANPFMEGNQQRGRAILEKYIKRLQKEQPIIYSWMEQTIGFHATNGIPINMGTLLFVIVIFNEVLRVQSEIDEISDMFK